MIKFKYKNMFEDDVEAIANPISKQGVINYGISKTISTLCPDIDDDIKKHIKSREASETYVYSPFLPILEGTDVISIFNIPIQDNTDSSSINTELVVKNLLGLPNMMREKNLLSIAFNERFGEKTMMYPKEKQLILRLLIQIFQNEPELSLVIYAGNGDGTTTYQLSVASLIFGGFWDEKKSLVYEVVCEGKKMFAVYNYLERKSINQHIPAGSWSLYFDKSFIGLYTKPFCKIISSKIFDEKYHKIKHYYFNNIKEIEGLQEIHDKRESQKKSSNNNSLIQTISF